MDKNSNSSKVGSVLVLGGGIAGIQSALDLAESGYYVYLVEKSPSIGGVMAQLDKTFPTNDCSICILSPKLVECGRHLNIELITNAEIKEISGELGNFAVTVKKNPRYIDETKCTACGTCSQVCPVELPSEFDIALKNRKAIYIPFPQAVPLKYTIDKKGLQPCRNVCPAGVGAAGYITLVARGKFYEALKVIKDRLPFPSICGRVCHRPCEKYCTRNYVDESVSIAHIKRFVGDLEMKIPVTEFPPIKTRAESVAIVGGGPAGLTAAHDLVMKGYHVTIYESAFVLGGMMRFGIPTFRLPKEILEREISAIISLGVKVYLNTSIGKDILIEDLFNRGHKAIFLAVGAQKGGKLNVLGEELKGVYQAIDFLKEVNLGRIITKPTVRIDEDLCNGCGLCVSSCIYKAIEIETNGNGVKDKPPNVLKYLCNGCGKCASVCPKKAIRLSGYNDVQYKIGNKVIVIGGGNAALDTARTALRLGAKEVTIMYRRSRQEMPAEPEWEIDETEREGVKFIYLATPLKVIGENGHMKAIEGIKLRLEKERDETGRRKVKPIPNSEFIMECESLILAIGQEVDKKNLTKGINLELTPWKTIKVDPVTLATNINGIFCGGDAVLGAGTVIEAIAAGKEVAISIDRYLNGEDLREGREIKPKAIDISEIPLKNVKKKRRVHRRYIPIEERKNNFDEVELNYTEEEAIEEARRCLMCGGCVECFACIRNCKAQAVDHQQKEEEIELNVGSIIMSTGFDEYDPSELFNYGYKKNKNVVTSIEFERILSASGPYGGEIIRPSDKKHPKNIAFIQCVGSRDKNNSYCSTVCCTYAIKESIVAKEHQPDLDITIFFLDMRTQGKGFDAYYERAKKECGIRFIRSKVSEIAEADGTGNLKLKYQSEDGKIKCEEFDLVVLSVGLATSKSAKELSRIFGISLNEHNFCKTDRFAPIKTTKPGIFVAGVFQGPKDIPDSVSQASAAASEAACLLAESRWSKTRKKEYPLEIDVKGQEPRVGVFICHCGINIGGVVDVPKVLEFAKTLPNVIYAEDNLYTCSQDTQEIIKEKIKEYNLNRIVVASCSPRTHEPLFRETIREAGLNKYLFEMANIRDHCSWVHMQEKEKATEKAKDLVKMAIAKARLLQPLEEMSVDVINKALIIGGGIAGITSTLQLSRQGFECYLIEKDKELGGNLRKIYSLLDSGKPQQYLQRLIDEVKENKLIHIYTDTEIKNIEGYVGNFKTTIQSNHQQPVTNHQIEHGIVIVATGGEEYKPQEYLYGQNERIITQLELEERFINPHDPNSVWVPRIRNSQSVVMIQCVGSRCNERNYCSKVCCSQAIKNAIKLKELNPEIEVYILYRDIRTYGFNEDYYHLARGKGVIFIRYDEERKPNIRPQTTDHRPQTLIIEIYDEILGENIEIPADLLVLSSAIVPTENEKLAKMLKVPLNENKFFLEAHVKLRPVDFATDGVFLCGIAHSPKPVEESISQAMAAAARASIPLSKGKVYVEPIYSVVDKDKCIGCGLCESLCSFSAIRLIETDGKYKAETITASCKGCGTCSASCPQRAITMQHFDDAQIISQIKSIGEEIYERV